MQTPRRRRYPLQQAQQQQQQPRRATCLLRRAPQAARAGGRPARSVSEATVGGQVRSRLSPAGITASLHGAAVAGPESSHGPSTVASGGAGTRVTSWRTPGPALHRGRTGILAPAPTVSERAEPRIAPSTAFSGARDLLGRESATPASGRVRPAGRARRFSSVPRGCSLEPSKEVSKSSRSSARHRHWPSASRATRRST